MSVMIARWAREPLLQFLFVGLALFGLWRFVHPAPATNDRIVVTEDDLNQLAIFWTAQGRPPPTPQQMQRLVEEKVRQEVLYREALALGLDKDDTIVKRQLARKMEFLAEDVSKLEEPSPEELRAWYEKNKTQFALPARVSFRHLYFSPDRRGRNVRADAESALAVLANHSMDLMGRTKPGDPFMFQDYYGDRAFDLLAKEFGPAFARALFGVEPGVWAGPIESGYGWHLVFVESLTPERTPDYDEIAADVKAAWVDSRRDDFKRTAYEAMRARYEVVLPAPRDRQNATAAATHVSDR